MQIPHNRLTFDEAESKAVHDVVASGHWAGGPKLVQMEEALSNMFGVSGAVGVGSGLSAIRLALLSLGVGSGDEVLVPAYSCVALANAVLSVGAIPIAVDIDPVSLNITVEETKKQITNKSTAIIAVNTFGVPCNIAALKDIGLPVIEDCSHGFSVTVDHKVVALQSDIAIFSFYATKLISGGEGGAILSMRDDVINFCRQGRDYTDQAPDAHKLNDKMTDMEAALILLQLKKLDSFLVTRSKLASYYNDALKGICRIPTAIDGRVWYRYTVGALDVDGIVEHMEEKNIAVRRPVENWLATEIERYPNSEKAFKEILSIPLYPSLSAIEQKTVCQAISEILRT